LIIVATFFALVGSYRLLVRKKRRIYSKVRYFIKNKSFDLYWIYVCVTLLLMAVIGLLAYYVTESLTYFLCIIFLSIFLVSYLNAFLHYNMNDYHVLQNIEDKNRIIRKQNKKIEHLQKRMALIKNDIAEGKSNEVGEG